MNILKEKWFGAFGTAEQKEKIKEYQMKRNVRNFKPRKMWKMWEHKGWGDRIGWTSFEDRRVDGHIGGNMTFALATNDEEKARGKVSNTIEVGDGLMAEMKSGKVAIFKFVSVNYCDDPRDMFFANVHDVGYAEEEEDGESNV